ncbi:DUF695 domain-containing protein [Thermopetrobacter sp. TC1]|uniref:DUF695 domain-containing protein n=1 Tax=Thermopetrobacter sp. TC1 TaxID=1495045 RepID=UPI00056E12AC|nr:DUF695 domain-containing protein [Thermopetrobacter sp. TC1]
MSAKWDAFATEIDGVPAWIVFNADAARELPQLDLPNLMRVQAPFKADEDGLPLPVEEKRLEDLEDELEKWVGAIGGLYVGHVTALKHRTFFFYVSCGREEAKNLVRRIALRRDEDLAFHMEPDPENRVFLDLMLPTKDERRRMRDHARIAEMRLQGDDLSCPRPVEHTARFSNRHQAIAFANWARKNRFHVDGILSPNAETPWFVLQFHRRMPLIPEEIDADTAAITEMAEQLGGSYEGWSCEICRAEAV